MATHICLHVVCGYLHTPTADLGRTYAACKATDVYRLSSYKKYCRSQLLHLLSTGNSNTKLW